MQKIFDDLNDIAKRLNAMGQQMNALQQQNNQLKQAYIQAANAYQGVFLQTVKVFKRLEVKPNKIVFVSYDGNGYGCNPKYIAEEFLRRNLPVDLVWLVKNPNFEMPTKIRKVIYNSLECIYELSTAKVIVTNEMSPLLFEKKMEQYLLMTWHAAWGIKYSNLDLGERVTPALINAINASNAITDLMLAGSDENYEEIRRSFDYKGEVLKCGLPRQDLFFKPNEKIAEKVKKSLGIPDGYKTLIYVPTFRDSNSNPVDVYGINFQKLIKVLEEKFSCKWILLLRLHPILSSSGLSKQIFPTADNILDVTSYPDVQELLFVSDAVLTDYSSVVYDFMLQNKPAFILAKDLDLYQRARGLQQHYWEMPFKINRTEDELFNYIKNFDADDLKAKIKAYIDKIKPYDTGDAACRVVNKLYDVMKIHK